MANEPGRAILKAIRNSTALQSLQRGIDTSKEVTFTYVRAKDERRGHYKVEPYEIGGGTPSTRLFWAWHAVHGKVHSFLTNRMSNVKVSSKTFAPIDFNTLGRAGSSTIGNPPRKGKPRTRGRFIAERLAVLAAKELVKRQLRKSIK